MWFENNLFFIQIIELKLNKKNKFYICFQNTRIRTVDYSEKTGAIKKAIVEMIIEDVRYEDEGLYECVIKSFHDSRKTKVFIKVHGELKLK